MRETRCEECGGKADAPVGCRACCRDCGFPCQAEKDDEGFHPSDVVICPTDGIEVEKGTCCAVCGVMAGPPCETCNGWMFHREGCPEMDAEPPKTYAVEHEGRTVRVTIPED
jgi:hypothetical protein